MSLTEISTKFTEDVLKNIVKHKYGPDAQYLGWKFAGGFKKGDSYLSEVFKVEIDAMTTNGPVKIYTVAKGVPKNVGRRKTFRSWDFFRNEINFYQKTMKSCLDFQEEVKPEEPFTETGVCLDAFYDGTNDWIIMEDLTLDGYTTVNRQTGMDFNHIKCALEALGKLHGLSMVYRHQRPDEFDKVLENVEETYYSPALKSWYKKFQETQEVCARHALEHVYPGSIYQEKLEELFSGDLYDKMVKLINNRNQYSALLHGDCWTPNFLFKYAADGKTPLGAKIIDFQLARYGSVALDISFFIYSCTDQGTREKHYDELMQAYHKSLSNLIKSFGSDPEKVFPWSAFQSEMAESARFGVGMGIESIPFSIMEDGVDLDLVEGEDAVPLETIFIIKPIETHEGRCRLADMFKHATECGYLD